MSVPFWLLGSAFLFWGWQVSNLWFGIPCALIFGGAPFIRQRWNFTQTDLDQIWNFCVLLFLGFVVYGMVSGGAVSSIGELANENSAGTRLAAFQQSARSMVRVLGWLPISMLPILWAQVFGTHRTLDWSTFSWWLRARRTPRGPDAKAPALIRVMAESITGDAAPFGMSRGLNVTWPMFAICLLSASAGNDRGAGHPVGLALLAGAALWTRRVRGYSRWAVATALVGIVVMGGVSFVALKGMQALDQRLQAMLGARWSGNKGFDPRQSRTALGMVGQLKMSGTILLRVESEEKPPELLREASYRFFRSPQWSAPRQTFVQLTPEADFATWKLQNRLLPKRHATILRQVSNGPQLLAVPGGTALIEDLPVGQLETNQCGAIQISEAPGLLRYRVGYDPAGALDSPPDDQDLDIPDNELAAVRQVGKELGLHEGRDDQRRARIAGFFAENFHYSTWLGEDSGNHRTNSPLSRFLLAERSGHCEYFATATVLLLRHAGIPARYASGFSVQEKRGRSWVIRGRHAHAWALAWVDGKWREVDNTPGSWAEIEAGRASWLERIRDQFSDLSLAFSKLRWGRGEWKEYVPFGIVAMVIYASWRLMSRKQWKRSDLTSAVTDANARFRSGIDSEFYEIERALSLRFAPRQKHETLRTWLGRINRSHPAVGDQVGGLLRLHDRLRFDPGGLDPAARAELRRGVMEWLERNHDK